MGYDAYRIFTMEPSFHIRVFHEYLSEADSKERGRISEQLLQRVSELAVIEEIRISIQCTRGWNRQPARKDMTHPKFRLDFIKCFVQKLSFPEIIEKTKVSGHLRALCKDHLWPKGRMDKDCMYC